MNGPVEQTVNGESSEYVYVMSEIRIWQGTYPNVPWCHGQNFIQDSGILVKNSGILLVIMLIRRCKASRHITGKLGLYAKFVCKPK